MKYDEFDWPNAAGPQYEFHTCRISHNISTGIGIIAICAICFRKFYLADDIARDTLGAQWMYYDKGEAFVPDRTTDDSPPSIFESIGNFSDVTM